VEYVEEDEDDEAEMPRLVLIWNVAKRCQFTLYDKMAAVFQPYLVSHSSSFHGDSQ